MPDECAGLIAVDNDIASRVEQHNLALQCFDLVTVNGRGNECFLHPGISGKLTATTGAGKALNVTVGAIAGIFKTPSYTNGVTNIEVGGINING